MGKSRNRQLKGLTQLKSINLIFCMFFCIGIITVIGQDPKTLLFQEAETQMKEAKSIEANIFSPGNFEEAMKNYQRAEEDYNKGKNLEDVRNRLKMATVYFLKSIETSKLSMENFKNCVKARNDALNAEANVYRREAWTKAEEQLIDASKNLEAGKLEGSSKKAGEAERLYREVEMESIKANYLDETRNLIVQGEKSNIKKKAPITLAKAKELVDRSEKLLEENPYDTDEARQIAREAKYEALHARYLSEAIQEIEKDKNKTLEVVLLESEKPLQSVSEQFDLDARFDQGYKPPTDALINEIQMEKQMISLLQQDLKDKEEQIATMSEQLTRLESKLGVAETEKESLAKLMEQQKIFRDRLSKIERSFTKEEAQINRVEDDVVIHLYGLNFPIGRATIEPQYYGLLAKVVNAFNEFPGCVIGVEGHTDSRGSDEANQELSKKRAEAVHQYLLSTSGISESRITATGYGETKPIASNDTKEGRRKNRRIDIIIHPTK